MQFAQSLSIHILAFVCLNLKKINVIRATFDLQNEIYRLAFIMIWLFKLLKSVEYNLKKKYYLN